MNFPSTVIQKYFADRLDGQPLRGRQVAAKCPLHEDDAASLSVNLEKGSFFCHAGCGKGGIVQFEKLFSDCSDGEAWVNISRITGLSPTGQPEAIYVYEDEFARPLFRVVRYPRDENGKKSFKQQSFNGKGWDNSLGKVRRVLYHLPEVITANEVFCVEGEKDADNLRALGLGKDRHDVRVTATTAPGGSVEGVWREEYSPYLSGKRVFIVADNDPPGREHSLRIAASVHKYAAGVKVLNLPVEEKGDVSDYLKDHTVEEFISLVRAEKAWHPATEPEGEDKFFVGALTFANTAAQEIDWAVRDVIPRGWNGLIVAEPKSLKSFSATDLLIHLALGVNWLGFQVPRRMKCAMLAREDNWGLTSWRIKHFLRGIDADISRVEELNDYLLINTRQQEATFALDKDEDLNGLIRRMLKAKTEFLLLDVFRKLHNAEENENTDMSRVLDRVTRIQSETGAAIGIVHHVNKGFEGSIFQKTRGASVIHGWMEWAIGLSTANPDAERQDLIRRMEFLNKAGNEPNAIFVKAEGSSEDGWLRLAKTDPPPKKKRNTADSIIGRGLPYKDND